MAATMTAPARAQARLNRMVGRPSGFIETLPQAVRGRIEYLRSLQEKHDDLEEEYNTELRALEAKYEALYGALRRQLFRYGRLPGVSGSVFKKQNPATSMTHGWASLAA